MNIPPRFMRRLSEKVIMAIFLTALTDIGISDAVPQKVISPPRATSKMKRPINSRSNRPNSQRQVRSTILDKGPSHTSSCASKTPVSLFAKTNPTSLNQEYPEWAKEAFRGHR